LKGTETRCVRPLVAPALALGTGLVLGLECGEGRAVAALLAAALGLGVGLACARRGRLALWTVALFLAGFVRGLGAAELPTGPTAPFTAEACAPLRSAALVGRWRALGNGRTGWIDDGSSRAALLCEPEAVAPSDGATVALLPGSAAVPFARGPDGPTDVRERHFAAWTPVAADELVVLADPSAAWLEAVLRPLARLRSAAGARVAALEGERSRGLLAALLTGERQGLAPESADLFARTGTSHLLALSGWHVGLFGALVLWPLARGARAGGGALLLRTLLLAGFALLAGAEKPIVRAALAWLFAELASLRRAPGEAPRRPDGPSFLAAALVLEALLDPGGVRSLSLLLSYAATLGLMLGTGPLTARLRRPFASTRAQAWERLGESAPRRLARVLGARFAHGCARALAASLAAVLATLPFAWHAFGEFAPAGALVTVLVMPPFTLLCLVSWLGALWPSTLLTPLAEGAARALFALLELGDALPWTPLVLPPRPLALLALGTVLVFLALRTGRGTRAAAALWGVLLLPWSAAPRGLELCALDVGHGTAVVLRAPGLEALVFDAGSRERRRVAAGALIPWLARREVSAPWVVLSHEDRDHAGALERLATRFPLAGWLGAAGAQGSVRAAHAPPHLDLVQGRLELGSPTPALALALLRPVAGPGNEGSRALELRWRGARLLLTGDAEEQGLAGLAQEAGPLRLLLAPHHGSDGPALGPFLARERPAEIWISAAGVPAIARELERRRLAWRWTGRDGPLALELR